MSEAVVFTKFEVFARTRGGTLIAWELNPMFPNTNPLTFQVLMSRSAVGDFIQVGTVVDTMLFEEVNQWVYGKDPRMHYQVRFTSAGVTYASEVKQAIGNSNDRDSRLVREMIRKEEVRQRLTGYCGYLYKRRVWGVKCTACTDYNTGQVTNSHCTTCFGTGFVGGYFSPVLYNWVDSAAPAPRRRVTNQSISRTNNQTQLARGLKCPWLDTGDVWVDFDSDQRYVIQTAKDLKYRGIAFLVDPVELRLAPATDIIYQLARPEDSSSSSSSSSGGA